MSKCSPRSDSSKNESPTMPDQLTESAKRWRERELPADDTIVAGWTRDAHALADAMTAELDADKPDEAWFRSVGLTRWQIAARYARTAGTSAETKNACGVRYNGSKRTTPGCCGWLSGNEWRRSNSWNEHGR
jgi:hypothetical protein